MDKKKSGNVVDFFTRKSVEVESAPKERRGKKQRKQEAQASGEKVPLALVGKVSGDTSLHKEQQAEGDIERARRLLEQLRSPGASAEDVLRDFFGGSSKFGHIIKFLNSLRIVRNAETLRSRAELVEGYTNDEIVSWLTDSTENEWKTHPEFYYALLAEAERRHLG